MNKLKLIVPATLSLAAVCAFSSCTVVEPVPVVPATTSTTVQHESVVQRPATQQTTTTTTRGGY
ncbi:MAG: hypothetical protein ABR526_12665 [Chthoniobacterales bacterium]